MPDHDPTSADAEWKKIQQRTFTRWCNEHLKVANIVIYDLETDLCDGIKLIVLLEVLAHKRVGKYNKKPNFKSQKLENVAIALKFIENENIKLVNIGKCWLCDLYNYIIKVLNTNYMLTSKLVFACIQYNIRSSRYNIRWP